MKGARFVPHAIRKPIAIYRHERHRAALRRAMAQEEGAVKETLTSLDQEGYVVFEGYWGSERVRQWQERLNAFYVEGNAPTNNVWPGAVRWHHVELEMPDLYDLFVRDPFLVSVVKGYLGSELFFDMIYQRSRPDERIADFIDADHPLEAGMGRGWHTDSWTSTLKGMLFMSDIAHEHGPLTYVPRSHRLKRNRALLPKLRLLWKATPPSPFDARQLYLENNEASSLQLEQEAIPFTGPAGTLVLVDTRGIHHAAIQSAGDRRVLWAYFS
jgi:hypothetical protein